MKTGIAIIDFGNGYAGIVGQRIIEGKRILFPMKYVKFEVAKHEAEKLGELVTVMATPTYPDEELDNFRKACEVNVANGFKPG